MSKLRLAVPALAVGGVVRPMRCFARWTGASGGSLSGPIDWSTGPGRPGLAWALTISAAALGLWVMAENVGRRGGPGLVARPETSAGGPAGPGPLYPILGGREHG